MTVTRNLADATGYPPGGRLVSLRHIDSKVRGRVVEVRDQAGNGRLGVIVDANHYLLDETVAIRFDGERDGIFGRPDDVVLVHDEGRTIDEILAAYGVPPEAGS